MPFKLPERVQETSTTTGTGTLTLAGAVTDYKAFSSQMSNGDTTAYVIEDGTDWEIGYGTYTNTSGQQLSRDTVVRSTNGNNLVNWGAGTRNVYVAVSGSEIESLLDPSLAVGFLEKTGDRTYASRTVTAFAKTLLDDANAAAALTTLGISAFIQTLLDDADAATARATLAADIQQGTVQATTSGTQFDFTSIPAGVKRVAINFYSTSLSGSDDYLVRLGDSGGIESTGYESCCSRLADATAVSSISATSGFVILGGGPGQTLSGTLLLSLVDAATNKWVASGSFQRSGSSNLVVGGHKTLSGTLDRLRILRNGTDTFDDGAINIQWEF